MNLHKIHPEAHDAWLYAMGIDVRWRHRSAPDVASDLLLSSASSDPAIVPTVLARTRCWVVGDSALSSAERAMLAAILWSVGLSTDEVVYLVLDELALSAVDHALKVPVLDFPAWSPLQEHKISRAVLCQSAQVLQNSAQAPSIWLIGDLSWAEHMIGTLSLPDWSDLMRSPELKKLTWAQLKMLRVGH